MYNYHDCFCEDSLMINAAPRTSFIGSQPFLRSRSQSPQIRWSGGQLTVEGTAIPSSDIIWQEGRPAYYYAPIFDKDLGRVINKTIQIPPSVITGGRRSPSPSRPQSPVTSFEGYQSSPPHLPITLPPPDPETAITYGTYHTGGDKLVTKLKYGRRMIPEEDIIWETIKIRGNEIKRPVAFRVLTKDPVSGRTTHLQIPMRTATTTMLHQLSPDYMTFWESE